MSSKFTNNLSFALLAQTVSLLLSIIMALIVPKSLGVEEYSYWQLFIFYSQYISFFHFGLNDGVYLKYGGIGYRKLDKSLIGSQFWFGALFQSLIAILSAGLALIYMSGQIRFFVIIMTIIFLLMNNLSLYIGYIFQASNETKLYSLSIILERASYLVIILILIFLRIKSFKLFIIFYLL